ncbi:MAG: alanine racemase [Dehalococcoidia bacterium]
MGQTSLNGDLVTHRLTRAEVDLTKLEHNYRYLRSRIDSRVKFIAVVKAEAYGHGAVETSRALERLGADAFAVAIVEEGVALREAGIGRPIIVFGGALPGREELVLRHGLTPAIHSLDAVRRLSQAAQTGGVVAPYHLKVDTGMGRMGVDYRHLGSFLEQAVGLPAVKLEGVFTHLASADEDSSDYSALQLQRFRESLRALDGRGVKVDMIHAANSAGLLFHPESWFDAVRPGLALYGVNPNSRRESCLLEPILSFKTCIPFLKQVPPNTPLGYGSTFVTQRDSVVATIPVGYADGLNYQLSNRGAVIVRDRLAPIVGRISMDSTLVDVTDVPEVTPGDEVILIGQSQSAAITAEQVAEQIGTIPYEILCSISKRVPRVCIGDEGQAGAGQEPYQDGAPR